MHVTRFSDYGLRVLMYLGRLSGPGSVTIGDIARHFDISHNHLVKVVGKLVKFGWVKATSGRNGGIRLGVEPEALQIGIVLQALEDDKHGDVANCDRVSCSIADDCFLRSILKISTAAFYEALNRYTLADILLPASGRDTGLMKIFFISHQG